MAIEINESDWKLFRRLHQIALERFCERVLAEVRSAAADTTYERISGGKKSRKKIAIVAVGRKLLVRCWAMLRDDTPWHWESPSTVATARARR